MTPSLSDELTTQGEALAAQLPDAANAAFAAEQAALDQRELPAGVVAVGDELEDFALPDQTGQTRSLSELTAEGPAVIVFYRGGWCPFCSVALRGYEPHLAESGARLVAISPERPDASLSTQEKAELSFTVLSDSGAALAERLGIAFQPVDEALAAQRSIGLDIREGRDDDATRLPYPTVLVVDRERVVRFADIETNYVHRTEVQPILDALAALSPAAH
jgi:peroxiredoxin